MNKAMMGLATGAALAAGLVSAGRATAHDRSTRATLATAAGVKIATVEFKTDATTATAKTGNAGDRLACRVIGTR